MMAPVPRRGEIWLVDLPGDKIRPVLVVTRSAVIPHLHSVIAAPVTSTIRGIPSELPVSEEEGLLRESVVNFDNLQLVSRSRLIRRIGALAGLKLDDACRALAQAVDC